MRIMGWEEPTNEGARAGNDICFAFNLICKPRLTTPNQPFQDNLKFAIKMELWCNEDDGGEYERGFEARLYESVSVAKFC